MKKIAFVILLMTPLLSNAQIWLWNFTAGQDSTNMRFNWTTTYEYCISHFTIEKSADNINFSPVDSIFAVGNSSVNVDYEMIDSSIQTDGCNYYRLKVTSGCTSTPYYFDTVYACYNSAATFVPELNKEEINFSVYPNPSSSSYMNVVFDKTDDYDVFLYDITGKLVFYSRYINTNQFIIERANLNNGIYCLKIVNTNQMIKSSIMVFE